MHSSYSLINFGTTVLENASNLMRNAPVAIRHQYVRDAIISSL